VKQNFSRVANSDIECAVRIELLIHWKFIFGRWTILEYISNNMCVLQWITLLFHRNRFWKTFKKNSQTCMSAQ